MASALLENSLRDPKVRAFLDMISVAEGTTKYGYHTLVGNTRLLSLAKHPGITVTLSPTLRSTAAGRYQFLQRTWNDVARALALPDFGPRSQDIAAVELIRRRGGLTPILQGRIQDAITAVRKEWASFPGAGYGQGEKSITFMLGAFNRALGNNAPASTVVASILPDAPPPLAVAGSNPQVTAQLAATVAQNPFNSMGTILLLGGTAFAVYYLFFAE